MNIIFHKTGKAYSRRNKTANRKKLVTYVVLCMVLLGGLCGRVVYLMVFCSRHYMQAAQQLHERERSIKAARGCIYDRNGELLASNRCVCSVSVIHSQVTDKEEVIRVLSEKLGLSEEFVRKRVEKNTAIERIKSNVPKETGDAIRECRLNGVKVDEDYQRFYPYGDLASKVIGFTGGDNQGIIGLEVQYEQYLKGTDGLILAVTDARGVEVADAGENRREPVAGQDLYLTLDVNIQSYATQLALQVMDTKQAEHVSIIVMNPQNGEIYAMADVPEFDLNNPFRLPEGTDTEGMTQEELLAALNKVWRNSCISDTYEPGSTFKIITAAAGLEEGVVTVNDRFHCPGYIVVEDRRIRCHKTTGHGSENFVQGIMNSCNPVFITVGLRLGAERYSQYFDRFGLRGRTGIDLPGEARTIMHKTENMGLVELATVSFGQSFQITPIQMAATASSLVNGGNRITPHLALYMQNRADDSIYIPAFSQGEKIVSDETSATLRYLLEQVVAQGTGKNGYVEGFRVGGKTATSQTLPRGSGRYIASFIGFAPADDPQVMALVIIHNPQGIYYGGQVAAPVARTLFENILPYLQ